MIMHALPSTIRPTTPTAPTAPTAPTPPTPPTPLTPRYPTEGGEPYSGLGASDAGGPGPGEWDGGAAEEGQKEVPPVAASADL